MPPKVDEAFKSFHYVPYSLLTSTAQLKAAHGKEHFVLNAKGSLTAKSLDYCNEKLISTVDWHAAALAAEEQIHFHHGEVCAEAFTQHHKLVMDLGHSHNDVQEHEAVALNPSHDLASLDLAALTIISTCPSALATPVSSSSPSKHSFPSNGSSNVPRKQHCPHCFWCGGTGHFPFECKEEQTTAGKPPAPLTPNGKSKYALLTPGGKQFCFNWAQQSSCSFGSTCSNFHGCSICRETGHSTGGCKSQP